MNLFVWLKPIRFISFHRSIQQVLAAMKAVSEAFAMLSSGFQLVNQTNQIPILHFAVHKKYIGNMLLLCDLGFLICPVGLHCIQPIERGIYNWIFIDSCPNSVRHERYLVYRSGRFSQSGRTILLCDPRCVLLCHYLGKFAWPSVHRNDLQLMQILESIQSDLSERRFGCEEALDHQWHCNSSNAAAWLQALPLLLAQA